MDEKMGITFNAPVTVGTFVKVEKGATYIKNNFPNVTSFKESKEDETEQSSEPKSAIEVLDYEVRQKMQAFTEPKNILLPVKGAKEALITLPFANEEGFNKRYGANISHAAWSKWINGSCNTMYEEKELDAYIKLFEKYSANL